MSIRGKLSGHRRVVALASACALVTSGLVAGSAIPAQAQAACQVSYESAWDSGGGFGANVTISVSGAVNGGWTLNFAFPGNQQVTQGWAAQWSQSGATVTATNESWNASIPAGGSVTAGFNGTYSGSNAAPTAFTFNGVACNGGTQPPPPPPGPQPPPPPPPGPQPPPPPPGQVVGWASVNGGTTGGAGGPTVTVTSGSQLISEMQSAGARTIQVQGTVTISGMNDVASNKTIIGLGSSATIAGGGLDIDGVSNVIVRNLTFRDWGDDAINLQDASQNVWIDHNSFTNGNDGAVDIKRESDYVTVSWNRFFNHEKTMLLGHSDGHTADIGHLRVTYHHNWFDGTGSRHPRVRFGNPVHVYNNYYAGVSEYGVASTMGAGVLVEGNYFENVDNPTHVGYAASDPGSLVQRNNVFVNSGAPESTSGGVNSIPYSYQMDNANNVRSIVMAGAGAGRI